MNTITGKGQPIADFLRRAADQIGKENIQCEVVEIQAQEPIYDNGTVAGWRYLGRAVILLQDQASLPPSLLAQIERHLQRKME